MKRFVLPLGPIVLVGLLASVSSSLATAQSPPLWGKLPPGPHAVGFQAFWELDFSRRYNMTFEDKTIHAPGKAPRPILITMWYPAKRPGTPKPMPQREYLEIQSADPRLAKFATKLAEYERAVIAKEVMGKPAEKLTDREKPLMNEFLDTPTSCIRDAPPVAGSFPLVIYHSGFGSSFEDNSVLCEFLASHGYVVLGSAFQEPSGTSFNVDGKEASARDMEFLIQCSRRLPSVDWNHIGIVGHSGGAQAALTFRAENNSAVDAVVSLDTTQDYYGLADPRWKDLTTTMIKNSRNVTGPVLMVASPHAFFEMADSLTFARRYYLTVTGLDHNDFISQGGIRKELHYRLRLGRPGQAAPDSTAMGEAKEKASLETTKAGYESVCAYLLHFLDAELKGDAAGKEFLTNKYRDTKLGGAAPHVEYVPEGRTGPDLYQANSSLPPTPRQLRYFLREQGSEKTVAVLRRFQRDQPTPPICHPIFGLALIGDLLDEGKTHDAIVFRDYYRETGFDCGRMLLDTGKLYLRLGGKTLAANCFRKVLLLEPSNSEAADKLKKAEETK
jgi:pimeloyl-ACP methyl ester carboxylesterase